MGELALTQDELNRRRAELASIPRLWSELNDPRRFAAPQVTIEAIMFAVAQRGLGALQEAETQDRLARCDEAAKAEINRRIAALQRESAP